MNVAHNLNTCRFDSDVATETGQLRVIRANGKSLDETSTIITEGKDGVEGRTRVDTGLVHRPTRILT